MRSYINRYGECIHCFIPYVTHWEGVTPVYWYRCRHCGCAQPSQKKILIEKEDL